MCQFCFKEFAALKIIYMNARIQILSLSSNMSTVSSTGALTFTQLATVFGVAKPYKMSSFIRGGTFVPNGPPANANIPTTTLNNMKFSHFRGSMKLLMLLLAATSTNYNLYNAFVAAYGTPSAAVPLQLTINSGVTVGATATSTAALTVGQFPSGSTIAIINNGLIYGAGGAGGAGSTAVGATGGAGGKGGTAIQANYLNQTVTITNNGTVYGGGGGGGGGGKGGTGGTGSNGSGAGSFIYSGNDYNWQYSSYFGQSILRWGGGIVGYYDGNNSPTAGYYRGAYLFSTVNSDDGTTNYYYQIAQGVTCYGGAGGAGGNGGAGATGRGYNNPTNALTGAGGAGGAAGAGPSCGYGTAGGTGATGGAGGASGNWGAAGSNGAGSSVGAGGAAGTYLLKGTATVTLTGGTVGGTLA